LRVIPVIDLMQGQVVRARLGDRASYQPLNSPLSSTSDAVDIARGLLAVYPFPTLYVADLDAIQNHGDNVQTLRRIRDEFPALQLWVDNGATDAGAVAALIGDDLEHDAISSNQRRHCERSEAIQGNVERHGTLGSPRRHSPSGRTGVFRRPTAPRDDDSTRRRQPLGTPVIGSESQRDSKLIARHRDSMRIVLSLDFRGDAFQGPQEILAEPALWPHRIIVMTLARVGSGAGPDLARFAAIRSIAGGREIYAAGGVRDASDLSVLKAAGAFGALISTALHERRIVAADLQGM
jgi:uncharacterized protein related to proFAR isomerase